MSAPNSGGDSSLYHRSDASKKAAPHQRGDENSSTQSSRTQIELSIAHVPSEAAANTAAERKRWRDVSDGDKGQWRSCF